MTEWRYSKLMFTKKIMIINNVRAMPLQSERVLEVHFPAIWIPEFQEFLLQCPPWGYLMGTVN